MKGKRISCEKDFDLTEGPLIGDCAMVPANEKSEKGAKPKGEAEVLEDAELKSRIAGLVKQPRMIEFMKRLKSLEEAVR